METRVPLKFAGRQERAGGSFPPSRLEREEEAGEVPPTPGKREGKREKGKGEEKRAGPGNHLCTFTSETNLEFNNAHMWLGSLLRRATFPPSCS